MVFPEEIVTFLLSYRLDQVGGKVLPMTLLCNILCFFLHISVGSCVRGLVVRFFRWWDAEEGGNGGKTTTY